MIEIEGLKEAQAFLFALSRDGVFAEPLEKYGRNVEGATKPYVSAPPQSTYRRTGNLMRQWYVDPSPDQVVVGNRADYSGWVQNRPTQAWMHRQHGWHTIQDRAESIPIFGKFRQECFAVVRRLMRRYGGT